MTATNAPQVQDTPSEAAVDPATLTDGFHLLIDALKLNGINTIYNVPGIPITDLGRYAQAQGMRVISFRHEQHAGYAASVAGFLTKKPGRPCSSGSRSRASTTALENCSDRSQRLKTS